MGGVPLQSAARGRLIQLNNVHFEGFCRLVNL